MSNSTERKADTAAQTHGAAGAGMDDKTLTALQGSIKKWEQIVNGDGFDNGADNCPLCVMFNYVEADEPEWALDGCFGCPVAEHVQESGCMRTPYEEWAEYTYHHKVTLEAGVMVRKVVDEESKRLAQCELDFLRALLPSTSPHQASADAAPCATCNDDPEICSTVPGLRHCEKAQR